MADTARNAVRTFWAAGALSWVGRWFLLVPESALLIVLLAVYAALERPQLVAVFSALLIVFFAVRALALHLARLAIELGRYNQASALLRAALMLYPWSADALAMRGTLALAQGDAESAERSLRLAIRLLPSQPSFYTALSSALITLGRPKEAAEAARSALQLDESHAQAYLYLAEAQRAGGAAPHAVEEQLRTGLATATTPEPQATLQCALAAHLLAERRFAEASLALHSAEALLPKCPALRQAELRFLLGELLAAQGQVERAREHFQGVEALDPHGRFAAAAWRGAHL